MSQFRGLSQLTRAYLLQTLRSRAAIFWNLLFPIFWLLVFGYVFAGGSAQGTKIFMPGLFTITIISGSFFGVSYLMVSEREAGILRRYRVTPLTASTVVTACSIRAILTLAVSLSVQAIVGKLLFGFTIEGSLGEMAIMMLLGAIAFVSLGLIVGSVAQDMRTAPAISNLLFLPMMFLSGAAMPFFMLPPFVQQIGRLLPATYLVEGLQGIVVRGEGLAELWGPIVVLLLTAVVGAILNSALFRWESDQPVDRLRVLLVTAGLLLLFVAAALLAPALRMTVEPS